MEKDFMEVFPDLEVDGELADLLDVVQVTRVGITRKKDLMRVYIVCSQWIHKKHIFALEKAIKEQFFRNIQIEIKIIEKFYLSRQYTPKNLMGVYRSSILTELREYSVFLCNLFQTASITFPETDVMELELVDSVIAHERVEELLRILEKIFCERCGLDLKIHTSYRKQEQSSAGKRVR